MTHKETLLSSFALKTKKKKYFFRHPSPEKKNVCVCMLHNEKISISFIVPKTFNSL